MKLIVGGFGQGKLNYACKQFQIELSDTVEGSSAEFHSLCSAKIINHYHLFLKEALRRDDDIVSLTKELFEKNPNVIIIADEIGCGLVPMDAFERKYRDETGHLLCEVAKQASEVHRVFCGLGSVIKHD